MFPPVKFRLNEFKQIGGWLDDNLPPLFAWLAKAFLWGLEDKWIDAKIKGAMERALASEALLDAFPESSVDSPVITETRSEVEGLDDISITAPWMLNNSSKD